MEKEPGLLFRVLVTHVLDIGSEWLDGLSGTCHAMSSQCKIEGNTGSPNVD